MQFIKFVLLGTVFGVVMVKAQIISWFRIFEMFQFDSFHMYGIIGSAIGLGIIGTIIIKLAKARSINGEVIQFNPKNKSIPRYLIGGILFGLGWALVGACPGPIFVLLGAGYFPMLIVLFGALIGTFSYGTIRSKLPH